MAVVQPFNSQWKDGDFFNIAGTVSTDSAWLDTRKAKVLFVSVNFAASGTATGTFSVQATEFTDLVTGIVTVTPTIVYAAGAPPTVTNGTVPYLQAGGGYMLVYEQCPSYVRMHYIFATAGATVRAAVMGRAT